MTKSIPSAKSLSTVTFRFGELQFPVKLYKKTEVLGLSGHLFHDGCNGKIRQWKTCENHPNTTDPATFSAIEIGNQLVELTASIKTQLLGGDCGIDVVSSHKIASLSGLLSDDIAIYRTLDVAPQQHFEYVFDTLLNRLKTKRSFLLVTLPDQKTKRYGILLSSGVLLVLFYEEEIREDKHEPGGTDSAYRAKIDVLIQSYDSEFPELTAQPILSRIESFFRSLIAPKKITAYKKKGTNVKN